MSATADGPPRLLDVPGAPPLSANAFSPQTAERIDAAVQRIVQAGFDRASAILGTNRALLDRAAQALLVHETLDEAEITRLTQGLRLSTPPTAKPEAPPQKKVLSR
jgi:cell division protease FtsH